MKKPEKPRKSRKLNMLRILVPDEVLYCVQEQAAHEGRKLSPMVRRILQSHYGLIKENPHD